MRSVIMPSFFVARGRKYTSGQWVWSLGSAEAGQRAPDTASCACLKDLSVKINSTQNKTIELSNYGLMLFPKQKIYFILY